MGSVHRGALNVVNSKGALQLTPHKLVDTHATLQRLLRLPPHLEIGEGRMRLEVFKVPPAIQIRLSFNRRG